MDKDEKNWITWNRMLMKDISKMRIFRLDSKESFQHRHRSNKSGRDFQTMGPKKEKDHLMNFSLLMRGTEGRATQADQIDCVRWEGISSSDKHAWASL